VARFVRGFTLPAAKGIGVRVQNTTMKTARKICGVAMRPVPVAVFSLTIWAGLCGWARDIQLDVLKTRTGTFTNVTVYNQSKTDIFFHYPRGIANVKIRDLDETALRQLGLAGATSTGPNSSTPVVGETNAPIPNEGATKPASTTNFFGASAQLSKVTEQLREQLEPALAKLSAMASSKNNLAVLGIAGALIFSAYLFCCQCLRLICLKTGNEPGILIWLPILQLLPLLRAASMSAVWFLAFFVPVLNLIAQIVWCFKIAKARGKSAWVGFFLLLPGISGLAFLYLAFSGGVSNDDERKPVRIARGAAALVEA
jgi:hypothetical protein